MDVLLERICVDPAICHGQACIKGTRIMVWQVLSFLSNGDSSDTIIESYPVLTQQDIQACLHYAALSAKERIAPVSIAK